MGQRINRFAALQKLDPEIVARLFGKDPWPADAKTIARLDRMFLEMGLEEEVGGERSYRRTTPFGRDQNVELLRAFLGVGQWFDFFLTLEKHGLMTEEEGDFTSNLGETTAADFMAGVMRPLVQRAYLSYCGKPPRLI